MSGGGIVRGWQLRRDAPWQAWSGSSSVNTLVNKRLELASVFQSALESYVMVMGFEPETFEGVTAT